MPLKWPFNVAVTGKRLTAKDTDNKCSSCYDAAGDADDENSQTVQRRRGHSRPVRHHAMHPDVDHANAERHHGADDVYRQHVRLLHSRSSKISNLV